MTQQTVNHDKLLGGIYGLLVGDALGVPYEFKSPNALPPRDELEFQPPQGFARSHPGVPPGYWSDDGAQALCLLASLLFKGGLELEDFAVRLRNWLNVGYMAAGGKVFDVGIQTAKALASLEQGVAAEEAGPVGEWDNGNGSLMRVLPLALWHRGTDRELFDDACRQSKVTHGHPRSQICCGLFCLWARGELLNYLDPWQLAVASASEFIDDRPTWRVELLDRIRPEDAPGGKGSGYVVDCLHSARLALEATSFEGVVKSAVALGNDTDTTAAVAGGIAGVRFGYSGIPVRWLSSLEDARLVEPLCRSLVEHWA